MSSFFQDSRILSDLQNSPLISEALGLSLWEGFLGKDKVYTISHMKVYAQVHMLIQACMYTTHTTHTLHYMGRYRLGNDAGWYA